jgi:MFS family permease
MVVLAALGAMALTAPRAAAQAPSDEEVLTRFAPVLLVREQGEECGDGERFLPVAVESILGRDDVTLRDEHGNVVRQAPTVADLVGGNANLWIDLPGNTLDPGCDYERWFDSLGATPAVYGRVTEERDQLVLQYWFFWVYNQWNDVHEGDWEMVQLVFDTDDLADLMTSLPLTYAYAQHEGSEYATAGDAKVQLADGTHPVVYAAQGSHAAFFSPSRWFGKSGATGFGCDDTSGPSTQLFPDVIVMPRDAPTTGEFAWLSFLGHWGEKAPAFDNGPTGPITKTQWNSPVTWVDDEGREDAVKLPFAASAATESFCRLSEKGSLIFNRLLDRPLLVITVLAALVAALVIIVIASSRGLLRGAARAWRQGAGAYARLGLLSVLGALLAMVGQWMLVRWTSVGTLLDVVESGSAWSGMLLGVIDLALVVPATAWVMSATVATHRRARTEGGRVRPVWWGGVSAFFTALVLVLLGLAAALVALLLIVVSRWMLGPPVGVSENSGFASSLTRSHRLIRGHGWRALGLVITVSLILGLAGVIGALVLVLTPFTFAVARIVVAAVAVVLVPYAALIVSSFYDQLVERRREIHYIRRGTTAPAPVVGVTEAADSAPR